MALPDPVVLASLNRHLWLRNPGHCGSKLHCDLKALTVPEFTEPLRFGLFALGTGIVIALSWRLVRARRQTESSARPIALAGLLFAAAALAGYQRTDHLVVGLTVAVILLAAGGVIADAAKLPLIPRMLLAVPGAFVIAERSALPDPEWARLFVAVVAIVGAGLVADLDRRNAHSGIGLVLLAVTMIGLYESVPDPDFALLLVGAALPVALLGWPVPLARIGGGGAAAASGLLAWADAVGGRGRLSAVIAGAACLGLFAIEPLAHAALRRRRTVLERLPRRWWVPVLVGLVQLGLAAACTLIAASGRSPLEAGEIAAAAFVLAIAAACALSKRATRPRHSYGASPVALKPEPALAILPPTSGKTAT
jgi:hypothetical protein